MCARGMAVPAAAGEKSLSGTSGVRCTPSACDSRQASALALAATQRARRQAAGGRQRDLQAQPLHLPGQIRGGQVAELGGGGRAAVCDGAAVGLASGGAQVAGRVVPQVPELDHHCWVLAVGASCAVERAGGEAQVSARLCREPTCRHATARRKTEGQRPAGESGGGWRWLTRRLIGVLTVHSSGHRLCSAAGLGSSAARFCTRGRRRLQLGTVEGCLRHASDCLDGFVRSPACASLLYARERNRLPAARLPRL